MRHSQAGLIAGRYLARWAELHWRGKVDELLLLELPKAGQVPNARILGRMLSVVERLVWLSDHQIKILRTSGHYENTIGLTRNHLRRNRSKRILVAAINDPCALGVLEAFRDAGREEQCAIVGHNASPAAHPELARKGSRLIGSVGYFPERFGESVIPLALDILAGSKCAAGYLCAPRNDHNLEFRCHRSGKPRVSIQSHRSICSRAGISGDPPVARAEAVRPPSPR